MRFSQVCELSSLCWLPLVILSCDSPRRSKISLCFAPLSTSIYQSFWRKISLSSKVNYKIFKKYKNYRFRYHIRFVPRNYSTTSWLQNFRGDFQGSLRDYEFATDTIFLRQNSSNLRNDDRPPRFYDCGRTLRRKDLCLSSSCAVPQDWALYSTKLKN